uniref:Uncharacterized protein n=1 Tax=Chlamydomonas euryale TaxID=1486919 RepID=A0A7R9Z794_9CHLO|mmetsp:Transcript_9191/g.27974  ORF Transcript_9191/g.27974 Transcript_9191/m.27974 type:complete len:250 (+) Transcript_9191:319-1068(+)
MTSDDLKAQANAEFQSGSFLKAAAAYTKAIKVDPQNAVLYSNRSAALLKLSKLSKAMDDAAMCIQLRPEWEKGYFRKAAVLEAEDKNGEALAVYQHALSMCPDNKDLSVRVAALQRRLNGGKGFLNGAKKAPAAASQAAAAAPAVAVPAATAVAAEPSRSAPAPGGQTGPKYVPTQGHVPEDLGSPEVAAFVQEYLEHLTAEVQAGDALVPMLHVLPSAGGGATADDPACHVRAAAAFDSPDTVASFVE